MKTPIPLQLQEFVMQRADFRCKYCLLHQADEPVYSYEIDHVIAEKHFGQTVADNLAYACFYCSRFKGSDIASIDPLSDQITPLFNPRIQLWHEHFLWDGPIIIPLTGIARTTARLL